VDQHVTVRAGEKLVAGRHDEIPLLIGQAAALVIGDGRRLLQNSLGADHLARHEVVPDAEVLE
jgi:hypothetical protein